MTTPLPTLCAARSALFLDFDGTLAELAPHPDAVQVPATLPALLTAWHQRLGGALAIVTGRARADLLRCLPAAEHWPGAFEHGAVRVGADGQQQLTVPPADLRAIAARAQAFVARHPGLVLELKQTSLSLHFRRQPELGPACAELLAQAIADRPGLQLLQGKAVIELKPARVDKGSAIAALLATPPFTGRRPCFAGDDTTDEDGFEAVQALGGEAIKVGQGPTRARHRCAGPTALRAWLQSGLQGALEAGA